MQQDGRCCRPIPGFIPCPQNRTGVQPCIISNGSWPLMMSGYSTAKLAYLVPCLDSGGNRAATQYYLQRQQVAGGSTPPVSTGAVSSLDKRPICKPGVKPSRSPPPPPAPTIPFAPPQGARYGCRCCGKSSHSFYPCLAAGRIFAAISGVRVAREDGAGNSFSAIRTGRPSFR